MTNNKQLVSSRNRGALTRDNLNKIFKIVDKILGGKRELDHTNLKKIDCGIYLGLTQAAIAIVKDGEALIIKSDDNQIDTTPCCVAFNKKRVYSLV